MDKFEFRKFLALTSLVVAVTACAKNTAPSSAENSVVKHSSTFNGQSYESYFRHFLFAPQPCSLEYSRYYKFASTNGVAVLASDPKLRFTVTTYLFPDQTYRADFELLKPRPDINDYTYEVLDNYDQRGKWAVENEVIVLENLGVGKALIYNERQAFDLHVESTIARGIFNQSDTILTTASSTSVPDELEVQCN